MTATCDTGAVLLRNVLADPASDDSRLIYADWLEEQGEADRAEFIRVQIRLLGMRLQGTPSVYHPDDPDAAEQYTRLVERERELWAQNRQAWEVRCPGFDLGPASRAWWVRGFLTEIHLPLAAFLEHARDLFSRHPITAVVLASREPRGVEFLPTPDYSWTLIRGDMDDDPAFLPLELWDRLAGFDTRHSARVFARRYPSPEAAHAALSAAAVSLGRELAGLPPLG